MQAIRAGSVPLAEVSIETALKVAERRDFAR
jgi:hypothetical protein